MEKGSLSPRKCPMWHSSIISRSKIITPIFTAAVEQTNSFHLHATSLPSSKTCRFSSYLALCLQFPAKKLGNHGPALFEGKNNPTKWPFRVESKPGISSSSSLCDITNDRPPELSTAIKWNVKFALYFLGFFAAGCCSTYVPSNVKTKKKQKTKQKTADVSRAARCKRPPLFLHVFYRGREKGWGWGGGSCCFTSMFTSSDYGGKLNPSNLKFSLSRIFKLWKL